MPFEEYSLFVLDGVQVSNRGVAKAKGVAQTGEEGGWQGWGEGLALCGGQCQTRSQRRSESHDEGHEKKSIA